ncbi:magnesium/cobalt transporter CorA [candidate division KSB1 bacterium]|nr:magnesium/cobalt transporter CorA [candidate division KSB1 bacterium]
MRKFITKSTKKAGLPPGTLIHIGDKKVDQTKISIIDYDDARLNEKEVRTIEECFPFKDQPTVTWINIDGLHDVEVIEKIGKYFDIHPLILEDILHTGQRSKIEDLEQHVYIVTQMLSLDEDSGEIQEEQLSIILGPNFVISFQEKAGDVFDPVRERIRTGKVRIRKSKADYLTYSLLDTVVDNYFLILDKLAERIEVLEEEMFNHPSSETLRTIHNLKRQIISLRRTISPLREVISRIEREEFALIHESTSMFYKDVYDHIFQIIETVDTLRDLVTGLFDTYLTNASNKMNEIMKVLTIIATIFIPLTFIAGIYGMNFKYIPELEWRWGYFLVLFVMLIVFAGMIVYFRRKKWL